MENLIDKIISKKIYSYENEFHECPHFIKLPLWVSNIIRKNNPVSFKLNYNLLSYRGLILCETSSITELDEIEVF